MMIIRKANERGQTRTDWLQSYHTFSFANYYDENFLGFGDLLVINEDTVQPSSGFGAHSHQDMEIITYVIEGAIAHRDSTGESEILKPGEIQKMSAGEGVTHSEFNPSSTEKLHFLQIWIIPRNKGLKPSYEQKKIPQLRNELKLIGSPEGGDSVVTINQNAKLYVAYLDREKSLEYSLNEKEYGWLQLVKGKVQVNNESLSSGDGVAIIDEEKVQIECLENAEFLLFIFERNE